MKKLILLAGAALLFAAPTFAQTEKQVTVKDPATGAKTQTEVKVRDNGTVKVESESRTGRTKAGEKINDAAQGTKEVGKDVAHGTKKAAHAVGHGTKKAAHAVGHTAEKGAENVKDAVK